MMNVFLWEQSVLLKELEKQREHKQNTSGPNCLEGG